MGMLKTLTNPNNGKPYADDYLAVQLSNIRKCLNDPELEYAPNMTRGNVKAKAEAVAPSKGVAPDDIPAVEKTTNVKILEQIKNALVIMRGDENPNFDVVVVVKLLQQASEIILAGK